MFNPPVTADCTYFQSGVLKSSVHLLARETWIWSTGVQRGLYKVGDKLHHGTVDEFVDERLVNKSQHWQANADCADQLWLTVHLTCIAVPCH